MLIRSGLPSLKDRIRRTPLDDQTLKFSKEWLAIANKKTPCYIEMQNDYFDTLHPDIQIALEKLFQQFLCLFGMILLESTRFNMTEPESTGKTFHLIKDHLFEIYKILTKSPL